MGARCSGKRRQSTSPTCTHGGGWHLHIPLDLVLMLSTAKGFRACPSVCLPVKPCHATRRLGEGDSKMHPPRAVSFASRITIPSLGNVSRWNITHHGQTQHPMTGWMQEGVPAADPSAEQSRVWRSHRTAMGCPMGCCALGWAPSSPPPALPARGGCEAAP